MTVGKSIERYRNRSEKTLKKTTGNRCGGWGHQTGLIVIRLAMAGIRLAVVHLS